jgi:hypothetical protein
MNEQNQEQINEDLVSAEKILAIQRSNRRHLAEYLANLAGEPDLKTINQLRAIEDQIVTYEAESHG